MNRHCWILLALCLFFTKKNYLSGAYAFRCSATFAYAQTVSSQFLTHTTQKNIMTPEDLKNLGDQKFKVDIPVAVIRLIEITNRSQEYLREIYKEQLILKEMVKGATSLPEGFEDKLFDLEKKIWDSAEVKYHELLNGILDTED
jgi:hypothetical protein